MITDEPALMEAFNINKSLTQAEREKLFPKIDQNEGQQKEETEDSFQMNEVKTMK
jgi:hypothetical protein